MDQTPFFAADQGDGWWDCPSPLTCVVIDGPRRRRHELRSSGSPPTFWLVTTDPAIEWNGDARYAEMWGEGSPLCHPIEPTRLALVFAEHYGRLVNLDKDFSIPMYPVLNITAELRKARTTESLGMKVTIYRGTPPS